MKYQACKRPLCTIPPTFPTQVSAPVVHMSVCVYKSDAAGVGTIAAVFLVSVYMLVGCGQLAGREVLKVVAL